MGFWTDQTTRDPKRNYRFLVTIANYDQGITWYAKSVSRPSFTVEGTEHAFLNHTFKYPTRTKWDDVTLTLVDPVSPDAASETLQIIKASGYDPSVLTLGQYGTTATKAASTAAMGSVNIKVVQGLIQDGGPANTLEEWTLHAPWMSAVKFSELAYDNDDLGTVELTIKYDWATFKSYTPEGEALADKVAGTEAGSFLDIYPLNSDGTIW